MSQFYKKIDANKNKISIHINNKNNDMIKKMTNIKEFYSIH